MVALLLKTPDILKVVEDFLQQFGPQSESPDFFDNDGLVLDFLNVSRSTDPQHFSELLKTLVNCRLKPIAFRNASTDWKNIALSSGLIESPAEIPRSKSESSKRISETPAVTEVIHEVIREIPGPATLVIDKPLRSGQKIYARGADLVVLAMVNMGAEVVADGNIHVYAPLRGKAMAGASGNTQARIFSLCLEPELISIAGVYRTSENPLAKDIQGKPAQVRLSNDGQEKLLFEALNA